MHTSVSGGWLPCASLFPVRVALTALGSQTPKKKEGPQAPKNEKEVRPKGRSVGAAQPPYARGIEAEGPRPAGARFTRARFRRLRRTRLENTAMMDCRFIHQRWSAGTVHGCRQPAVEIFLPLSDREA